MTGWQVVLPAMLGLPIYAALGWVLIPIALGCFQELPPGVLRVLTLDVASELPSLSPQCPHLLAR